jgi:hypothetical protein
MPDKHCSIDSCDLEATWVENIFLGMSEQANRATVTTFAWSVFAWSVVFPFKLGPSIIADGLTVCTSY